MESIPLRQISSPLLPRVSPVGQKPLKNCPVCNLCTSACAMRNAAGNQWRSETKEVCNLGHLEVSRENVGGMK